MYSFEKFLRIIDIWVETIQKGVKSEILVFLCLLLTIVLLDSSDLDRRKPIMSSLTYLHDTSKTLIV